MKPFDQITMLRKSGRLDEAYEAATAWRKKRPKDPWRQLALFWVLRDLCKRAITHRQYTDTETYLNDMSDLLPTLPDTKGAAEKAYQALVAQIQPDYQRIQSASGRSIEDPLAAFEMVKDCYGHYERINPSLHESLGWILYRYLRHQREVLPSLSIRKALALYLKLYNPRPSRLHSLILNFAFVYSRDNVDLRLHPFFLLWDPSKLQAEDLIPSFRNNTSYPSLLGQVLQRIVPQIDRKEIEELVLRLPFSTEVALDYIRQAYLDYLTQLSHGEDTDALWRGFNQYLEHVPLGAPSKAHTGILLLAHQLMQGDEDWRFARFWLQWGVESFEEKDWYPKTVGAQKPSVVETIAKHALSSLFSASQSSADTLNRFCDFFRYIAGRARPNDWALHGLAKMEAQIGNQVSAISCFKRLLLDAPEEYRYWLGLSVLVKDQPEAHVAICCKTLLLESAPEKIGDLRLDLAQSLLAIGQSAEALTELRAYKADHPQLPERYHKLLQNIETRVTILPALGSYYERRVPQAEDFVFQEFPLRKFVLVSWIEQVKGRLARLSDGGDILLHVAEERFPILKTLREGSVVKIRLRETKVSDPSRIAMGNEYRITYDPLSCSKGNDPQWSILPLYKATVTSYVSESRSLRLITDDGLEVSCYTDQKPPLQSKVSFRGYFQPLKEGRRLAVATFVPE